MTRRRSSSDDMKAVARILAGLRDDVERIKEQDAGDGESAHEAHRVVDEVGVSETVTVDFDVSPQAITASGADTDHGTVNIPVTAELTATAADTDSGSVTIARTRALTATGADTDHGTADLADTPFYDVTITGTNAPVTEGADVDVSVTVENTGNTAGADQTVELHDPDGVVVDTAQTGTLTVGATSTHTLSWTTENGDAGLQQLTVVGENDTASTTVEIESGTPNYDIIITGTNTPVDEGSDVNVSVDVENIGTGSGDVQTVELLDGTTVLDSKSAGPLDPGDRWIDTLTWDTSSGDAGSYTLTAAAEDNSDTASVTVDPGLQYVDDFESYSTGNSDLMNTYTEGASGASNFAVVSNGLLGTSQSLLVTGGSTQSIEAYEGDGSNLDNYIDNGDTFRFAWNMSTFSSGNRGGVWYGIDLSGEPAGGVDSDAHYGAYRCWVESDGQNVQIDEWYDYSRSNVATVDVSNYTPGETWECEVTWNGSGHDLTVYDDQGSVVGTDSGSDSAHDADGTVGYSIDDDDGNDVQLDQVRIL